MSKIPPAPTRTGPSGRKLWRGVLAEWELEPHEVSLLAEAVRTVDTLDELQAAVDRDGAVVKDRFGADRAHPALVEARQLRVTYARLLAALRLPDGTEGDESQGRRQRRVGARGTYGIRGVA